MSNRILIWIDDSSFLQYSISTIIAKKTNDVFFAIADINKFGKSFLESQSLLTFSNIFYYRDNLPSINKNYDGNYLKYFEKKYRINLWTIIFSERLFYNFTTYYKPTTQQILSITEYTCRFFEKILDESKPDFLFIKTTDNFQNTVLFELAKSKNIKILTFSGTKLANSSHVSLDTDAIDKTNFDNVPSLIDSSKYLENHDPLKKDIKKKSIEMPTSKKRLNNLFNYLKTKSDPNYFPNYGKKSMKFILKNISLTIKSYKRKNFLNNNSIKEIEDENYVYFPLHVEPERSLLITCPFYSDQINVITNIAKSLPIGYTLYVKEHGSMELLFWRDQSFYKKIIQLPNVKLLHPSFNSKALMEKCSLLITIAGTTGIEALFSKKPVIVFSDVTFSKLPNVFRLTSFNDLSKTIRKALTIIPNNDGLEKLVSLFENECLDIDMIDLQHECQKYVGSSGMNDIIIPKEKNLKKFIEYNFKQLEIICNEHLRKMELHKKNLVEYGSRRDVMNLN